MTIRKKIATGLGLGLLLAALPVQGIAALKQGAKAPDFTLEAAQGGKSFSLSLKQALKQATRESRISTVAIRKGLALSSAALLAAAVGVPPAPISTRRATGQT